MLIMCMFIAQSVFAQSYSKYFRLANQDTVNFTFTVKKPDIKAIDCYPQRITQISKTEIITKYHSQLSIPTWMEANWLK